MTKTLPDQYSERETQRRFEAALRSSRLVGHKQQSEMKLGKRKAESGKSPRKRKAVKKSR